MSDQPELDFEFYIPAGREAFRVWEVARIIRHSSKLVIEHIEAGKFGKCTNCGSGKKASYIVPRAGLVAFVKHNSH